MTKNDCIPFTTKCEYPKIFSLPNFDVEEIFSHDQPLTEYHVQVLWLKQKFLCSLKTVDGFPITVISPGIWNQGAGPDFLKAHIRIGQIEYRGDIEIHLKDEGWFQHQHHLDAHYNQIILHVSLQKSKNAISIFKENGEQPFLCHLDQNLPSSTEMWLSYVEDDVQQQFPTVGRCEKLLFSHLSQQKINELFQSAAYWRLEKKLNFLETVGETRSIQFAAGLSMALGYKHNSTAFLELFLYLLDYRDLPRQELLAIALGCCGFLEQNRKQAWESSSIYQDLRKLWWGKKDQITHQAVLKLHQIRPFHHPIRRLVYLTYLLQDNSLEQFWSQALKIWETALKDSKNRFKKVKEAFLKLLPTYSDPYWDYHFTFETKTQSRSLPSLGQEIKMHFLLNTILPLLYGTIKPLHRIDQWEVFQSFYASLDISTNSKSHYLKQRFLGNREEAFIHHAQMTQGAYQIHQDFCVHFESSCQGCPFVERYQAQMKNI